MYGILEFWREIGGAEWKTSSLEWGMSMQCVYIYINAYLDMPIEISL